MPVVGALPLGCAATCAASVRVQEMGMEAAVRGNLRLLNSNAVRSAGWRSVQS